MSFLIWSLIFLGRENCLSVLFIDSFVFWYDHISFPIIFWKGSKIFCYLYPEISLMQAYRRVSMISRFPFSSSTNAVQSSIRSPELKYHNLPIFIFSALWRCPQMIPCTFFSLQVLTNFLWNEWTHPIINPFTHRLMVPTNDWFFNLKFPLILL